MPKGNIYSKSPGPAKTPNARGSPLGFKKEKTLPRIRADSVDSSSDSDPERMGLKLKVKQSEPVRKAPPMSPAKSSKLKGPTATTPNKSANKKRV